MDFPFRNLFSAGKRIAYAFQQTSNRENRAAFLRKRLISDRKEFIIESVQTVRKRIEKKNRRMQA